MKQKRYDNHFLSWYFIQTFITSIILGSTVATTLNHNGVRFWIDLIFMSFAIFSLCAFCAMDFYQKDIKEQKNVNKKENVKEYKISINN